MPEDDDRPKPFGSWSWPRFPRSESGPIELQIHQDACGVACAVMLLADRGIYVGQHELAERIPMPTGAMELAEAITAHADSRWEGGSLSPNMKVNWRLIDGLTAERGSWAALLEPMGFGRVGHWVVVDGVSTDGLVLVRDPKGSAYGVPLSDFAILWGYTMLVTQEVSR